MTLHSLALMATMGGVFLIAAASPGPNFFVASQLALSGKRRLGYGVALGIGTGSAVWATLAMLGVAAIMAHARWLMTAIRITASLYLIWMGVKLVLAAFAKGDGLRRRIALPATGTQAFRVGLATNLTNPKACAFWTGIFGSMFPADAPLWMFPATTVMMGCLSGGWYCGVTMLFSTARVQRGYERVRAPIDGLLGILLLALGAHLAVAS